LSGSSEDDGGGEPHNGREGEGVHGAGHVGAAAKRIALKRRATRKLAQGCGTQSVPRQGHNTPLPLMRSPPVSFKRLLGGAPSCFIVAHPDEGARSRRQRAPLRFVWRGAGSTCRVVHRLVWSQDRGRSQTVACWW